MKAQKWNWHKHEYEPYDLPEGSLMYHYDMDKKVACAQCGQEITYGDSYNSWEVHNNIGIGYAVCEKCYKQEWRRKIDAENREADEWED